MPADRLALDREIVVRSKQKHVDAVRAAYADGRIPASRANYWLRALGERPEAAAQLASLAPGLPPQASAAPRRPLAAATTPSSRFPDPRPEEVNPSVAGQPADVRQHLGPAPTLFATGNLPPFTASGLDVNGLYRVPWQARPRLAAAPTLAEALRIVETVLAEPDPAAYAAAAFADDDAVIEYRSRVAVWLWDAVSAAQQWLPHKPNIRQQ